MQRIKIKSDYDPNTDLTIIKNDDGDIIVDISGTGEFRIATSGGQYHGNKLVRIVKLFSEMIEFLSEVAPVKLEGKVKEEELDLKRVSDSVVLYDEAEKSKAVHNETLMDDLAKVRVLLRPIWQEYDAAGQSWGRSLKCMALETAMGFLDRHISLDGELINRMDRHREKTINKFWSELRQLERDDIIRYASQCGVIENQ